MKRYILVFIVLVGLLVLHQQYVRWKNMKKPCVPFHEGMTLEPGQCAYIEPFKMDIPKRNE